MGEDWQQFYSADYQGTYRILHEPALVIGGCFVVVALFLSILLIFQHLRSYTKPAEQKWIVAVLFMVPVYACQSIISLWNPRLSLSCDILRSCYEAFALYSFGSYLVACLGGRERVIELLEYESRKLLSKPLLGGEDEKQRLQQKTLWNFFMRPCVLGKDLLRIEKSGLVQYMILKTVCAFLAFILEIFGVYGDGEFSWHYGYPYIAVVLNFSQMWALFCLVQFYNVTHERLQSIKPLAKFISFKAIVFATWWQGVGIALLCSLGVLPKQGKFQTGLQDFLICIEIMRTYKASFPFLIARITMQPVSIILQMALAAVAHIFVFSADPYKYIPPPEYEEVTMETAEAEVQLDEDNEEKPSVLETTETHLKAPGTSISESVQDIVLKGGQHVVEDVVLTINQAIEPVERGVTKIQETFHQISVGSGKDEEEDTDLVHYSPRKSNKQQGKPHIG